MRPVMRLILGLLALALILVGVAFALPSQVNPVLDDLRSDARYPDRPSPEVGDLRPEGADRGGAV